VRIFFFFLLRHNKNMSSVRKTPINPKYFSSIKQETFVDPHRPAYEMDQQAEWYPKGKTIHYTSKKKHVENSDEKIRYQGKDALILVGQNNEADIRIDLKDARRYVQRLRDEYATERIYELDAEGKKAYESIKHLVEALHGTAAYQPLHDIIQEEFQCAEEHRYRLGTVGAYFCECGFTKDFPGNPNCSLGCLAGLNRNLGDKPCGYTCLTYVGNGNLSLLQSVQGSKDAYLFVDDAFDFRGLRDVEINQLQSLGIQRVKIIRHSEGSSYHEMSHFNDIHRLHIGYQKPASTSGTKTCKGRSSSSGYAAGLLLFLLILFVLVVLWLWYKQRKTKAFSGTYRLI
jgi:hypothetical protein